MSISIPDELAEQLKSYANGSDFKRSGAVAHILTAFFEGEVRSPDELDPASVAELADQLDQVVGYLDELREKKPKVFHRPGWVEDESDSRSSWPSGIGRGSLRG